MPAPVMSRDEIVDRLFKVFRDQGFDGASLADLSRATGLGRSSLYHYFPEGKAQMADAVLERASALIDEAIVDAARAPGSLKSRVRRIAASLDQMYSGGRDLCVLGQLAADRSVVTARDRIAATFERWIDAFDALAREAGMTRSAARVFAEDLVARLQGALLMQTATHDAAPFRRVLDALLALAR